MWRYLVRFVAYCSLEMPRGDTSRAAFEPSDMAAVNRILSPSGPWLFRTGRPLREVVERSALRWDLVAPDPHQDLGFRGKE